MVNKLTLMVKKIEKFSFLTSNFSGSFVIYFISLSFRVIPQPSPVIYSLLSLSICLTSKCFPKLLAVSVPFLATLDKIFPKIATSLITQKLYEVLKLECRFHHFVLVPLELPIKFDERFKVISVPFFITDFSL